MTTIAWDGQTLAADTRCTSSGLPYMVTKAWKLSDGRIFSATGQMSSAEAVRAWIDEGAAKPATEDSFTGMMITRDGDRVRIQLCDKNLDFYEIQPYCGQMAIGSGRDFAIAAMSLGKSAREAVELASKFDVWTGLPVVELAL